MKITARYQDGDNKILLDFDKPVLQLNIPQTFYVNDQPVGLVTPGPTTDSLWISPVTANQLDDLQLSYVANQLSPLLYLSGPATDRLIPSFSVPVIIGQAVPSPSLSPILGDFIDAFGLEEAITISNPDNALATSPDEHKFQRAFEDAEALWDTYLLAVNAANRSIINAGKRRTMLIFTRYFLDSRCRRKNVTADYEAAIDSITRVNDALIEPTPTEGLYGNTDEIIYESYTCGINLCNGFQCPGNLVFTFISMVIIKLFSESLTGPIYFG
jgi:phage gp36-like protein